MKKLLLIPSLFCLFVFCTAEDCVSLNNSTDLKIQQQQEKIIQEANAQAGMPGITNFTEKKLVKKIYELRDQNISTYTYLQDMNGKLWHLCDSIGYGLPYSVQYSNPQKEVYSGGYQNSFGAMPQAEPNGLFMPDSAEGTWVMCADPSGQISPVYVEPRTIVSPFKLNASGEYFTKN